MSSLFLPNNQEELNLLEIKKALKDSEDVLLIASHCDLYFLKDFDSKPNYLHTFVREVNAIAHRNMEVFVGAGNEIHVWGKLNQAGILDWIFQMRSGEIMDFCFCSSDQVFYDAGHYGVYDTLNQKEITSKNHYNALCDDGQILGAWWGDVRTMPFNDLYSTTRKNVDIRGMLSLNGDLFSCGEKINGLNPGFVKDKNDDIIAKRDSPCIDIISYGGNIYDDSNVYDICQDGTIFNTFGNEQVYDFDKPITAVSQYPEIFVEFGKLEGLL